MKKAFILSFALAAFAITACNSASTKSEETNAADTSKVKSASTPSIDTTKLKTGDVYYQCEMHPEVFSGKAGTCPKCGMNLQEMKKK